MTDIALNNVHMHFGFNAVLDGVDFEIESGEKAAIVGANGTGKTTLFRIITGQEACDKGQVTLRRGASLGYLEQSAGAPGNDTTVETFLREAQKEITDIETEMRQLENRFVELGEEALVKALAEYDRLQNRFLALNGYAAEEDYSKVCGVLGINEKERLQRCASLSGGRWTIVKLAAVLLRRPDILLLDEPTNHIDIDALRWLEEFISSYNGTVVLVSHDRYFMDKTIKKTIMLEEGHAAAYKGNYSFCQQEQDRLMMLEIEQYKNRQKQIEAMKTAIKRFREWGARGNNKRMFRRAENMEKRLVKLEAMEKPRTQREMPSLAFGIGMAEDKRSGASHMSRITRKRMAVLRDVSFDYNDRYVLKSAEMEVFHQDRVCLMGANGSGKTTLLRLILGELTAGSGEVVLGEGVKLGYIEQVIRFEQEQATVLDTFKLAAAMHENDARKILARYFFYGDYVFKRVANLSGGERVMLKLALLALQSVNFLILDEPTNYLDIDAKEMLEEALAEYPGTILFVSHDRFFINKIAGRVAYLEDGALQLYDGNYDDYIKTRAAVNR